MITLKDLHWINNSSTKPSWVLKDIKRERDKSDVKESMNEKFNKYKMKLSFKMHAMLKESQYSYPGFDAFWRSQSNNNKKFE